MILLIGFMAVLICVGIAAAILFFGRYLSRKSKKAEQKTAGSILLQILLFIIASGMIIFGLYVLWNIIDFVGNFP